MASMPKRSRVAPPLCSLGKLQEIIAELRVDLEVIDELIAILERLPAIQNGSRRRSRPNGRAAKQ